jgi:hypothetical protein
MVGPPEEAPFDEVDRAPIPVEVLAESEELDVELEEVELDDAALEEDERVVEVMTTHPPSAPGLEPGPQAVQTPAMQAGVDSEHT